MIPLRLWYSHDQKAGDIATTHAELDVLLDRLSALSTPEWPALAEVTPAASKYGPALYVGLHVDLGALRASTADDPGPYYTVGEGSSDGEPILYMYTTSDGEVPANAEIPAALVRQAAHEFADTGVRPTCVDWQIWKAPVLDTESEFPE